MKKFIGFLMAIVMVLPTLLMAYPLFSMPSEAVGEAGTQYTFDYTTDSKVIVIDEKMVSDKGTNNFVIPNGAFSVTVSGNVNVTILFGAVDKNGDGAYDGITINNKDESAYRSNANALQEAGNRLGWGSFVPTCPFFITNSAKVHASFAGPCIFIAGTNRWTSDGTNVSQSGTPGGYAGIQVDRTASLTIDATLDSQKNDGTEVKGELQAYGAYQFFKEKNVDDPLKFNPIRLPGELGNNPYARPLNTTEGVNGGGAGIGGGVNYDTTTFGQVGYTFGTPGEIIINGGNILAVGGHQAAGIGGGGNGAGTAKRIVINGGNVKAIGGRWASAIGDGDSNGKATASSFGDPHEIIINGGNVEAYGGVAASGIGTTDRVTRKKDPPAGMLHGLSITLAGGKSIVHSGEADTDKPSQTITATAAIGAGQDTDMKDNSITIYSGAQVQAVSFSQYAISNYGTDADKKPTVNIDPDGYMYLARFTNETAYSENAVRTFNCYAIMGDSFGNPMLIEATANQMMKPVFLNNYKKRYYAYNRDNKKYYIVNKDGTIAQPNPGELGETDGKGRFYPNRIPSLSYLYDINKAPLITHTVPAKYKAIATTLPDPSMAGSSGAYILHVPDPAVTPKLNDDIYAVIQKHTPGTTSGEIIQNKDPQGNVNQHHVIEGENGKQEERPNINEDDIALPFVDINIFTKGSSQNLIDQYNGGFYPTVFGYTVYLPRNATDFQLDFTYETVKNTQYELKLTTNAMVKGTGNTQINGGKITGGTVSSNQVTHNMTVNVDSNMMELWIEKTDKKGQDNFTVVYKITAYKKPLYDLGLDDLTRTYDGVARPANVSTMFKKGAGFAPPIIKNLENVEDPNGRTSTLEPVLPDNTLAISQFERDFQFALVDLGGGKTEHLKITTKLIMQDLQGASSEKGIVEVLVESGSLKRTVKISIDFKQRLLGPVTPIQPESTNHFEIVSKQNGNGSFTIRLESKSAITGRYDYDILTISLDHLSENRVPIATGEEKQNAIIEQMKTEMQQRKLPSISTVVSIPSEMVHDKSVLKIKDLITPVEKQVTHTDSKTYNQKRLITITCDYDEDLTKELAKIPTSDILYTYYLNDSNYKTDADGKVISGTKLPGPPKDAGKYVVTATISSEGFEGYGIREFEILKRKISPISIENWRRYLTKAEIENINSTTKLNQTPGSIFFDNLVLNEKIQIESKIPDYCYFYEGGNSLTISFSDSKITLSQIRIVNDAVGKNYYFPDEDKDKADPTYYTFTVYGELTYEMDEAIFRLTEQNGVWDKFWPTTSKKPIDFSEGAADPNRDYHSPVSNQHREYVYLTSINNGTDSKRYSVDLEFGSMKFTYSKTVWNVNTHTYDDTKGGKWTGNNGTNNMVTIINRSNQPVYYKALVALSAYYGKGCESAVQKDVFDSKEASSGLELKGEVQATMEGSKKATEESFYVYMYGIPQISMQDGGPSTGVLTVTLSMNAL